MEQLSFFFVLPLLQQQSPPDFLLTVRRAETFHRMISLLPHPQGTAAIETSLFLQMQ
jgi:hypothetical protein